MNRYAHSRAFTLIELMITIAIAAILLTIAVPSFNDFVQKRAVSQKTVQIRGALEFARSLAVSQHQIWTVCMVDALNACVATNGQRLLVFQDASLNKIFNGGESLQQEIDINAIEIELSASSGPYIRFSDSGEAMESGNFEVCSENQSFAYGRRIIVFRSGRVRLSGDSDGDGYDDNGGTKIECHTP